MIWAFVLAVGVAITFSTLGAVSVWVKLLAAGLKVSLFALGLVTLTFVWKRIFRRKDVARAASES